MVLALRLAGQDDGPSNNSNQDRGADSTTGGNSYSGTSGTGNSINNDPWYYGAVKETKSISGGFEEDISTYKAATIKKTSTVVVVSGIILYVLFAIYIAAMIWVYTTHPIDMYANILKVRSITSLVSLYIIVDAFLVFFLYEKRASLFVFAFILSPFYPIRRNKVINGSGGIGTLFSLVFVISLGALIVKMMGSIGQYGGIMTSLDDNLRTEVKTMLEEPLETGETYGQALSQYFTITDGVLTTEGGQSVLTLTGTGKISYRDDGVFQIEVSPIPTTMVFVKNSSGGTYKLQAAKLNDKPLTDFGAASLWKVIEDN